MSYIPLLPEEKITEYKELVSPQKTRSFFAIVGNWISYLRYVAAGSLEQKAEKLFKKISRQEELAPSLLRALDKSDDRVLARILVLSKEKSYPQKMTTYLSIIENMLFERTKTPLPFHPTSLPSPGEIPSPVSVTPSPEPSSTFEGAPPPPPPPPAPSPKSNIDTSTSKIEDFRHLLLKHLNQLLAGREEKSTTKAFIAHLQDCIEYLNYTASVLENEKARSSVSILRKNLELRKASLQNLFERASKGEGMLEFKGLEPFPNTSPELEAFGKVSSALQKLDYCQTLVTTTSEKIIRLLPEAAKDTLKTTFSEMYSLLSASLPLLESVTDQTLIPSLYTLQKHVQALAETGDWNALNQIKDLLPKLREPLEKEQFRLANSIDTMFFDDKGLLKSSKTNIDSYGSCTTLDVTKELKDAISRLDENLLPKGHTKSSTFSTFSAKGLGKSLAIFNPITSQAATKALQTEEKSTKEPSKAAYASVLEGVKKRKPIQSKEVVIEQHTPLPLFYNQILYTEQQDTLTQPLSQLKEKFLTKTSLVPFKDALEDLPDPEKQEKTETLEKAAQEGHSLEELAALRELFDWFTKNSDLELAKTLFETIAKRENEISALRNEINKGNLEAVKFFLYFPQSAQEKYKLLDSHQLLILLKACYNMPQEQQDRFIGELAKALLLHLSWLVEQPSTEKTVEDILSYISNDDSLKVLVNAPDYQDLAKKIKAIEQQRAASTIPLTSKTPTDRFSQKATPSISQAQFSEAKDLETFRKAFVDLGENQANYFLAADAKVFSNEKSIQDLGQIFSSENISPISCLFLLDSLFFMPDKKGASEELLENRENILVTAFAELLCRENIADIKPTLLYLNNNRYDRNVSNLYRKIIDAICEKAASKPIQEIVQTLGGYPELQKAFFQNKAIDETLRLSVAEQMNYFDRQVLLPLIQKNDISSLDQSHPHPDWRQKFSNEKATYDIINSGNYGKDIKTLASLLSSPLIDAKQALSFYVANPDVHDPTVFAALKERLLLLDSSAKEALHEIFMDKKYLTDPERGELETDLLTKLSSLKQQAKPVSALLANCPESIREKIFSLYPLNERLKILVHFFIDCEKELSPGMQNQALSYVEKEFVLLPNPKELLDSIPDEGTPIAKKAKETLLQKQEVAAVKKEMASELVPHSLMLISQAAREQFFKDTSIPFWKRLEIAYRSFSKIPPQEKASVAAYFASTRQVTVEPSNPEEKEFYTQIKNEELFLDVVEAKKDRSQAFEKLPLSYQIACMRSSIPPHICATLCANRIELMRALAPRFLGGAVSKEDPLFPYVEAAKILQAFPTTKISPSALKLKETEETAQARKKQAIGELAHTTKEIQEAVYWSATPDQLHEIFQRSGAENFTFLFQRAAATLAHRFVEGDPEAFSDFMKQAENTSGFPYKTLSTQVENALIDKLSSAPSASLLIHYLSCGFSIGALFTAATNTKPLLQTLASLPSPLLLKASSELETEIPTLKKNIHTMLLTALPQRANEIETLLPQLPKELRNDVISKIVSLLVRKLQAKKMISLDPLFSPKEVKQALFSLESTPLGPVVTTFFELDDNQRKEFLPVLEQRMKSIDEASFDEVLALLKSTPMMGTHLEILIPLIQPYIEQNRPVLIAQKLSLLPEKIREALLQKLTAAQLPDLVPLFAKKEELAAYLAKNVTDEIAIQVLQKAPQDFKEAYLAICTPLQAIHLAGMEYLTKKTVEDAFKIVLTLPPKDQKSYIETLDEGAFKTFARLLPDDQKKQFLIPIAEQAKRKDIKNLDDIRFGTTIKLLNAIADLKEGAPLPEQITSFSQASKKEVFELPDFPIEKALSLIKAKVSPSPAEQMELLELVGRKLCRKKETSSVPAYLKALHLLHPSDQEALLYLVGNLAAENNLVDTFIAGCSKEDSLALEIFYTIKFFKEKSWNDLVEKAPKELLQNILLRLSPEERTDFFTSKEIHPVQQLAIGRAFFGAAQKLSADEKINLQNKLFTILSGKELLLPRMKGIFDFFRRQKTKTFDDGLIEYLLNNPKERLEFLSQKNLPSRDLLRIADLLILPGEESAFVTKLAPQCTPQDAVAAFLKKGKNFLFHKKLLLASSQNAKTAHYLMEAPPEERKDLLLSFFSTKTIPVQELIQEAAKAAPLFSASENRELVSTLIHRFADHQEGDDQAVAWEGLQTHSPFLLTVKSTLVLSLIQEEKGKPSEEIIASLHRFPALLQKEIVLKLLSSQDFPLEKLFTIIDLIDTSLKTEIMPSLYERVQKEPLDVLKAIPFSLREGLFKQFWDKAPLDRIFDAAEALDQLTIASELNKKLPNDFVLDQNRPLGTLIMQERLYNELKLTSPDQALLLLSAYPEHKKVLLERLFKEEFPANLFDALEAADQKIIAPLFAEKLLEHDPFDEQHACDLILSDLDLDQKVLLNLSEKLEDEMQNLLAGTMLLVPDRLPTLFNRVTINIQKLILRNLSLDDQIKLLDAYEGRDALQEPIVQSFVSLDPAALNQAFSTIGAKKTPFWENVLHQTCTKVAETLPEKEVDEIILYPEECLVELLSSKEAPPLSLIALLNTFPQTALKPSFYPALATRILAEPSDQKREEALFILGQASQIGNQVAKSIAEQKIKQYETLAHTELTLAPFLLKEVPFVRKHVLNAVFASSIDPLKLLRTGEVIVKKISTEEFDLLADLLSKKLASFEQKLLEPNPDTVISEFHGKIISVNHAAALCQNPDVKAIADILKRAGGISRIRLLHAYFNKEDLKKAQQVFQELAGAITPSEKEIVQQILKERSSDL